MSVRIDQRAAELARNQHGVLSRAQLTAAAVSRGEVDAQIAADRWQRIGRGIVLTNNGVPSTEQALVAALIQCPTGSAVSGPTAALLDGYRAVDPVIPSDTMLHITVPCGFRTPRGIGAQIHWSRHLGDDDVHPARDPRRTRVPRSVLDWASWQPAKSDRAVRAIILGGVQQGLTTPGQLREHLSHRGHCLHLTLIGESIDDADGGIASLPEHEFNALIRGAGLPKPSRQVIRFRPNGRAYLDVDWDEYGYSAEIEGAQHFVAGTRGDDLMRLNDFTIAGDRVLQFTSFDVRRRGELVTDQTVRALRSGGWIG
jgi:hypothetical protein